MAIARHWRQRKQNYAVPELEAMRTEIVPFLRDAGAHSTAHRADALNQSILSLPSIPLGTLPQSVKGTIYTFTMVVDAPAGFEEQAPYAVALIQLDDGSMMTAQITDLDLNKMPEIGMRVELVTRRISADGPDGVIVYGYKFRPPVCV